MVFLGKVYPVSTVLGDDNEDELLMKPLFQRLGGGKTYYEKVKVANIFFELKCVER